MQKSKILSLIVFSLLFVISSCNIDDDGIFQDCEAGEGSAVTIELNMPEFRGINLDANAEVHLTQGDDFFIEAVGEENIIELIELDVQNDIWKIEFERCVKDYDLKIFITMPEIEVLKIDGSGKIFGENLIIGDILSLDIDGSGDMNLEVDILEDIDGEIDGSGNIFLIGIVENLDFKIDGSGDLNAFDLLTKKSEIEIDGSGDASITATDLLEVNIDGSGNVYFKGNPVLDVDIDGSGDVVDAN